MDILLTEVWMPNLLNKINGIKTTLVEEEALNEHFEENGFESKKFMLNIGSSIIYLMIYLSLWLFALIASIIGKCNR
jgi:hypothetical protein